MTPTQVRSRFETQRVVENFANEESSHCVYIYIVFIDGPRFALSIALVVKTTVCQHAMRLGGRGEENDKVQPARMDVTAVLYPLIACGMIEHGRARSGLTSRGSTAGTNSSNDRRSGGGRLSSTKI